MKSEKILSNRQLINLGCKTSDWSKILSRLDWENLTVNEWIKVCFNTGDQTLWFTLFRSGKLKNADYFRIGSKFNDFDSWKSVNEWIDWKKYSKQEMIRKALEIDTGHVYHFIWVSIIQTGKFNFDECIELCQKHARLEYMWNAVINLPKRTLKEKLEIGNLAKNSNVWRAVVRSVKWNKLKTSTLLKIKKSVHSYQLSQAVNNALKLKSM